MTSQPNLLNVDWSMLPVPADDGAARHLEGAAMPDVSLPATGGSAVSLAGLGGRVVVYTYPRTGVPGQTLPPGWDQIPGARGCTPQACSFRDHYAELKAAGVSCVFGISTQSTEHQREAAERLHLPFPLLSDAGLLATNALRLPTLMVAGEILLKRLAIVIDEGHIAKVFYPVFPPDRNAEDVLGWCKAHPR